jgi:hypothetical protein
VKAIVSQTFYIPEAGKLYKEGAEMEVDAAFAARYASCLKVNKSAPAPANKMVTAEKEIVKTVAPPKQQPAKRGRKKNGV